ncbi:MAG TPA: hypothetical protein PLB11_10620, partial [Flavobacterium sp.]|nr:hypothetical protein [Flavobacterium sp.]
MEVFLLVLLIAFLFYIKNAIDSKFDRLEDRMGEKMDGKFKELLKKMDDLKGTETLPENPLAVPEVAKPKVTPEEVKPPVVFEKTEPMVFIPVEKEIAEEKMVFSMESVSPPKSVQPKPESKVYIPQEPT